jgi:SWI/SNF-related matrix-associated actin-dependent regulator 1 of chromatin subfamily A
VFSSHTRMLSWLGSKFNGSSVTIDGSVTGIKRHHAVDRFQKVKSVRLALCNPIAGGVGITLTSASNVAYTDLPWTPGALKQSADRIHRIGQKKPCFIWYLASKGTIEEKMFSMIQNKQEILDKVLDGSATGADFAVFNSLLKK